MISGDGFVDISLSAKPSAKPFWGITHWWTPHKPNICLNGGYKATNITGRASPCGNMWNQDVIDVSVYNCQVPTFFKRTCFLGVDWIINNLRKQLQLNGKVAWLRHPCLNIGDWTRTHGDDVGITHHPEQKKVFKSIYIYIYDLCIST